MLDNISFSRLFTCDFYLIAAALLIFIYYFGKEMKYFIQNGSTSNHYAFFAVDTKCDCFVTSRKARLECNRITNLTTIPQLTSLVTEFRMFRTSPTIAQISSSTFSLARGLKVSHH